MQDNFKPIFPDQPGRHFALGRVFGKRRTHPHCEEQSDKANLKPRFNVVKRCASGRKCRLDCFASLAMTGRELFFNTLSGVSG
jgi:hypothetical protein